MEILDLLEEGKSPQSIARNLGINSSTVYELLEVIEQDDYCDDMVH